MKKITGSVGRLLIAALLLSNLAVFNYAGAAAHSAGTNVISNGTIYMITDDGQRRPYTSAGAFLSYGFNSWGVVVPAAPEDMALPEGKFIPPRDGNIVCSDRGTDKGTCYLITNSKRAAFVSGQIFKDLGFSFAKALTGDVSFLEADANISASTEQHRAGVLINRNGTIYLVSPDGLMGIPSLEVLGSWGYVFEDAVKAVNADAVLSERSVIETRKGAKLSPSGGASSLVNAPASGTQAIDESSVYQGYVDTYPDLPTNTVSAPEDGTAVLGLMGKINEVSTISDAYQYLTAQSLEMLGKLPKLKGYLESYSIQALGLSTLTSNIKVFEGKETALYNKSYKQYDTSYVLTVHFVCKKENGAWKWDLIGTYKYGDKLYNLQNPLKTSTIGVGTNDIGVIEAEYTYDPIINDKDTWLVFKVRNAGQTTIQRFNVVIRVNNQIIFDETLWYEIKSGETLVLGTRVNRYWSLPNSKQDGGQYDTAIAVSFDRDVTDVNMNNNNISVGTTFRKNYAASSVGNIVGGQ